MYKKKNTPIKKDKKYNYNYKVKTINTKYKPINLDVTNYLEHTILNLHMESTDNQSQIIVLKW